MKDAMTDELMKGQPLLSAIMHLRHVLERISREHVDFDEVRLEVPFSLYHKLWYTVLLELGPPKECIEMPLTFKLAGISFVTQPPAPIGNLPSSRGHMTDNETEAISLPAKRERMLNDLAEILNKVWGPRCSRNEGGCASCMAWTLFDAVDRMTDSTLCEEYDQKT